MVPPGSLSDLVPHFLSARCIVRRPLCHSSVSQPSQRGPAKRGPAKGGPANLASASHRLVMMFASQTPARAVPVVARRIRAIQAQPRKMRFVRLAPLWFWVLGILANPALAEPVRVSHPQGWAHGFVEVTTLEGRRLAVGDLLQRGNRGRVTVRLVLNFFDGSVDDETTLYTQDRVFRLLTDHHVQHGPSFPKPSDVLIDAAHDVVQTKDESGKLNAVHLDIPADTYNGIASTILMNLPPGTAESTIAIVIGGAKPRIAHLKSTIDGKQPFTLGGSRREASEWTVHVELGGIAKIVAPIIGKEPPDYHVLIGGGEDPVFLREVGPLFEGGPIWRVQQVSAAFPE